MVVCAQSLLLAEEKGFSHLMNLPGIYAWWKDNPYAFTPEFRSYMESFRNKVKEDEVDSIIIAGFGVLGEAYQFTTQIVV